MSFEGLPAYFPIFPRLKSWGEAVGGPPTDESVGWLKVLVVSDILLL